MWVPGVQVVCTGKEVRVLDCELPQNFGDDRLPRRDIFYGDYTQFEDQYGDDGIRIATCRSSDAAWLTVACRTFELTGALPMNIPALPMWRFEHFRTVYLLRASHSQGCCLRA